MGRIFNIYEKIEQCDEPCEAKAYFVGSVVVDNYNRFIGYCDRLCNFPAPPDLEDRKYIIGIFGENNKNGNDGAIFYELSNDITSSPLIYIVPDIEKPENTYWGELNLSGNFDVQYETIVEFKEIEYSKEKEQKIMRCFDELDFDIFINSLLVQRIHSVYSIIINIK